MAGRWVEMFCDGKTFLSRPQLHRKCSCPALEHVKTIHAPPPHCVVKP